MKPLSAVIQALWPTYQSDKQEKIMTFLQEMSADATTAGLVRGALNLHDLRVVDIMIPKAQIVSLKMNDSFEKIMEVFKEFTHSRYPVFDDHGFYVKGIVIVRDLVTILAQDDKSEFTLEPYIRPPLLVPFSRRLHDVLNDFRRMRTHMALATDEHGLCCGLITIENVLEQIVGQIQDEHDEGEGNSQPVIAQAEANTFSVRADCTLSEFSQKFNIQTYEEDEFDTLGGFVTHLFGYLPVEGESVAFGDLTFKVLATDQRKLRLIEVQDRRSDRQSHQMMPE
ncbi:MAG: CBS domain-containing protein [Gammaproteobacteria bacterium]|nr:CBS domain-containing protein [Gammaproteobacteria bacterium]